MMHEEAIRRCWLAVLALAAAACGTAPQPLDAARPAAAALKGRGDVEAGLGSAALGRTLALGPVEVTPLAVREDSRCPVDAQCIQAGTVRLLVSLREAGKARQTVMGLDDPVRLANSLWLALAAVCPPPRAGVAIAPDAYRFTFMIATGGPPPPLDFAC